MTAGLKTAGNAIKGFQSGVQSSFGAIMKLTGLLGISFAAFKSAEGIAGSLKDVFAMGKELHHTAATTGQTIADIMTMEKAFTMVGNSAESVTENVAKMEEALGGVSESGSATGDIFRKLNLSVKDLKAAPAIEAMEAITEAINRLPNAAEKLKATRDIFGRGGMDMMAMTPQAFAEAREQMGSYAAMMQRNAGLFTKITNDLGALSGKVRKFFAGVADQIGPALLPLLDRLKTIDLMASGEKIGASLRGILDGMNTAVGVVVDAFQSGRIGELAGLSLRVGFEDAIVWLDSAMIKLFDGLQEPVSQLFEGLGKVFDGLGDLIGGSIQKAIIQSLRNVKIGGIEIMDQNVANTVNTAANKSIDTGHFEIGFGAKQMSASGKIGGGLVDMFAALSKSYPEAKAALDGMIDSVKANDAEQKAIAEWQKSIQTGGSSVGSKIGDAGNAVFSKKDVLSDRLAKIGLFIGGSGGPPGQRAQETTARHTAILVEQGKQMLGRLTPHTPATF